MTDNRNMILAIVLSVLILIGFQYGYDLLYPKTEQPPLPPQQTGEATPAPAGTAPTEVAVPTPGPTPAPTAATVTPPSPLTPSPAATRKSVLGQSQRIPINTPRLHGSIALTGGRLDDLTLASYHETIDRTSPEIVLFSPPTTPDAYFVQVGWVGAAGAGELPDSNTVWRADGNELTPQSPLTLTWTSPAGLVFKRSFAVDDGYLFTITQTVENGTAADLTLTPYALISRLGTPVVGGYYILHEGPLGVFDGTLKEIKYSELAETGTIQQKSRGGWVGITDKYWLSALIANHDENIASRFFHETYQGRDRYQVDYVGAPLILAPGAIGTAEARVFAGAKEVKLLDRYRDRYQIDRFDRAIDFGWFYFLTKPLFYFLIFLKELTGNIGVAILILTVTIKIIFFPLSNKSYRAMSQMRKLQPEIAKLKERMGDDKVRFNQEMMALYKREKVNPASGCLPVLIQIPVFFALYKVLFVTLEMRQAPFFGWIQDLAAPDPTSVWNLFGLFPWDPSTVIPHFLNIGAWPIIMGVTMWLQQRLNPQPPDPMQAKMFMLLPFVFTFFLASFPAGLVIYWAWNNILSIIQQWAIMRRMGVKP
ncbi:MAG: membrane protein insertase YidC [Defluviicoccus sp.]